MKQASSLQASLAAVSNTTARKVVRCEHSQQYPKRSKHRGKSQPEFQAAEMPLVVHVAHLP